MAIRKIIKRATDSLFTNPEFDGTEAARQVKGTTAERTSAEAGDLRFNTTTSLMEYYDGTVWKSIDTPPSITSVSPDNFDTAGDTITITGSFFSSDATVTVIANDGSTFSPSSTTYTNSSSMSFDITQAMVDDDNDPYDVKVTNGSGLSYTLENCLDFAPEPAWTVASGSLGTFGDASRSGISITTGATSTESDATITYAVTTGSLPSGLSISSSTGTISGNADAVGTNTTSTFTITATATDGDSNVTTNTRQYSITINAPVITSYTSVGSGTFSVPTGITAVDVLVVAGGGGTGPRHSGGGGAGGLIYRPAFPVTPGGSISYTVGAGGSGQSNGHPETQDNQSSKYGQDSVFGTLTAKGGGAASFKFNTNGYAGGSGGGGGYQGGGGGPATQPQQPGDSGTYGFGNNGGLSNVVAGGGGGGAGATGDASPGSYGGNGGNGRAYDISGSSVTYAGGGGGSGHPGPAPGAGVGGSGGGGDGGPPSGGPGQNGTANRGGGGGGGREPGGNGGSGGSGIVIVKY